MNFHRRWIVGVSLAACVIAFSGLRALADGPESFVGKTAPDFALKTLDGKAAKLSDQKGSVVLIDMWATWCGPCKMSLPHVQKISEDKSLADKGLKVWAVNAKEKEATVKKFLADNNFTFAVPMDTDGGVLTSYMVSGIPTTVIVGRDGKVANVFVGYGGEESAKEIDKAVQDALKKPGGAT